MFFFYLLDKTQDILEAYVCVCVFQLISRCVKHGLVLPVFNNLVTLSFGSRNKRGWKLLPYLVKQSPKLETLIIQVMLLFFSNNRNAPRDPPELTYSLLFFFF